MPDRLNRLPYLSLRDYALAAVCSGTRPDADHDIHLYGYARSALRDALRLVVAEPGSAVLYPDYICGDALEPLHRLNIEAVFYPVSDEMVPDWDALTHLIGRTGARAVMSVNYFGFSQPMAAWQRLVQETGVAWINDNAHGYGGSYNGKRIDTFGDVCITSMRKVLPLVNGAGLQINHPPISPPRPRLSESGRRRCLPNAEEWRRIGRTVRFLSGLKNVPPATDQPYATMPPSSEHARRDGPMGAWSRRVLTRLDRRLPDIIRRRREIYRTWHHHCRSAGLRPVFPELTSGTNPLVYPCYARDFIERQQWLRWGVTNNVDVYPWPSLPAACRQNGAAAVERWRRLLCFPIHADMSPHQITSRWQRGVPQSTIR